MPQRRARILLRVRPLQPRHPQRLQWQSFCCCPARQHWERDVDSHRVDMSGVEEAPENVSVLATNHLGCSRVGTFGSPPFHTVEETLVKERRHGRHPRSCGGSRRSPDACLRPPRLGRFENERLEQGRQGQGVSAPVGNLVVAVDNTVWVANRAKLVIERLRGRRGGWRHGCTAYTLPQTTVGPHEGCQQDCRVLLQ